MGGSAYGIDPAFPPKPPRMRWRTFEELQCKDTALRSHFLAGAVGVSKALSRRLRPR
jgi:hypothetical protein